MRKTRVFLLSCILLIMISLCGCSAKGERTKVVLTTGFASNELFRIEDISCTIPEMMVYLTNTQNQYESVFGKEIWNINVDDVTLEENVKDIVLARIAQIKTMNLLAKRNNITLDETELETVKQAAVAYFETLNEVEINEMEINLDTIVSLYSEYALANKVYLYIISDINPEISDDEARTITVEQIFLRTYSLNSIGEKIPYSEQAKANVLETMKDIQRRILEGESFETLMEEYSEDNKIPFSFGKGEKEEVVEKAAFELANGEVSNIVESEEGYHLIKCINTFNREETDANKITIMEQRKKDVFNDKYEEFVNSLTKQMNQREWRKITFLHDEQITTNDFFTIYDQFFKS